MRTGSTLIACASVALAACWPSALERLDASAACEGAGCDGGDGDLAQAGGCGAGCPNGASCVSGVCCAPVSFAGTIQPIFDAKCAGCHGGDTTPLNLRVATSYSNLLAAPSGQKCGPNGAGANFSSAWRRVAPGDLADSELWWYMQDCCAPTCGNACGPRCIPQCSQTVTRCGSDDPLCGQARPNDAERAAVQCWILEGALNN